jgi:hypothetical protein
MKNPFLLFKKWPFLFWSKVGSVEGAGLLSFADLRIYSQRAALRALVHAVDGRLGRRADARDYSFYTLKGSRELADNRSYTFTAGTYARTS